jgi:hypothetical protein
MNITTVILSTSCLQIVVRMRRFAMNRCENATFHNEIPSFVEIEHQRRHPVHDIAPNQSENEPLRESTY